MFKIVTQTIKLHLVKKEKTIKFLSNPLVKGSNPSSILRQEIHALKFGAYCQARRTAATGEARWSLLMVLVLVRAHPVLLQWRPRPRARESHTNRHRPRRITSSIFLMSKLEVWASSWI